MHICKPPQGFAFGIRKEFGPPRRPLGPLARNILGGIAVARLGAPKDSRAIYLPPAISLRRRHATSSSRGFFIARQLPSPPPHNIFIATQVFVRPLPPSAAASPRFRRVWGWARNDGRRGDGGDGHWNDGLRGTMGTGTTDCDLRWREHGLRFGTAREIFWPDGAWEKISEKDLMRMQNGWRSPFGNFANSFATLQIP